MIIKKIPKTKKCSECWKRFKNDSDNFYIKFGVTVNKCKKCYRKYYYKKNKEIRLWMYNYLSVRACEECWETNPILLDFHHNDPIKKDKSISKMIWWVPNLDVLKNEIDKCTILCKHCHTMLHAKQDNRFFYQLYMQDEWTWEQALSEEGSQEGQT